MRSRHKGVLDQHRRKHEMTRPSRSCCGDDAIQQFEEARRADALLTFRYIDELYDDQAKSRNDRQRLPAIAESQIAGGSQPSWPRA